MNSGETKNPPHPFGANANHGYAFFGAFDPPTMYVMGRELVSTLAQMKAKRQHRTATFNPFWIILSCKRERCPHILEYVVCLQNGWKLSVNGNIVNQALSIGSMGKSTETFSSNLSILIRTVSEIGSLYC